MSDAVIISIVGGLVSLLSLAMTLLIKAGQDKQGKKVDKLHDDVNGKMQQLIEARESAAGAIGKAEGKAEERAEAANIKTTPEVNPSAIPPINIEKVVVQTKTVSSEDNPEDKK